jgi:hypothetical protein
MRFEATGHIGSNPVRVAWEDGALTGNRTLIQLILAEAANLEGEPVGPIGQQTETNHLRSALSARLIIERVMPDAEFTGDVPEPEDAPPGAVI